METTTISDLAALLGQQLHDLEQQIAADDQQLRTHREEAAFVRGKLALLAQIVLPPIVSGDPLGEEPPEPPAAPNGAGALLADES